MTSHAVPPKDPPAPSSPGREGRDPGALAAGLEPVPGGTHPREVAALLGALRGVVLGDDARILVPHSPDRSGTDVLTEVRGRLRRPVPGGTAVILQTSGSTTGRGHLVALSARSLAASARATEQRLAGPGQWLLAVPSHHVAGLQVLVRSALAGTEPVVLDTTGGFDAESLAGAARTMRADVPGYLSLVPTQLVRVLDAGDDAVAALRRLAAILVGGAASALHTLGRARDAGLRVVTTYGMTETGGGCVYDGVPLPGVTVRTTDQRVEISGPVLASGYLDDPAADEAAFTTADGVRWLRTSDRGRLEHSAPGQAARLVVLGRMDDLINTGGVKVSPGAVERVLHEHPGVGQVVVVGVPDDEWGELVTAVLTVAPGAAAPALAELRALVAARLDSAQAPRALVVVPRLAERGPGKVDRIASARIAEAALREPHGSGVERHVHGAPPTADEGSRGR
ncbi:AMP-binding protein [Georgenia sp. SYP-B2076]|uniref:AMP-binding protein n=1 Tax=Georgenia sp. SYP-B2076 TaxID=2495881 RepID=UPI00197B03E6|nr:AMP-binding protein [Georgenia sp. SYP-B2076]